jgi:putative ABC transport system permease protein
VRSVLAGLDSTVPLSKVRLMDDVLTSAQSRPRFLTLLLSLFSGVALAIAIVGIYGVISYSVARRAREFGLRMALGAQQHDVLRMVLWQGASLTLWGTAIGVIGALLLARLMRSLLFGISATDPATFAGVALVLGVVAVASCYIPARRAMRIVPMDALRHE